MAIRDAVLGHVVLNVRNLRKAERFYREVLGMKVSGRNPRTRMCFLSFGREHHDVALCELPRDAKRIGGEGVPGLHHFCFYVRTPAEVDALYPLLKRRRVPIVSGPEILEVARNRSISFLDPDGNRVEVACNANKFSPIRKSQRRRARARARHGKNPARFERPRSSSQPRGGSMRTMVALLLAGFLAIAAPAGALDRFPIAHSALSASQAILFVTRDAGLFRKYDLEPQIVYIVGGPTNTAALLSGNVDFNVFAGPSSIAANLGGGDTVILMSFVNTLEHSIYTHPSIKRPEDLRGKKIGVSRPGSSDHYGATVALKRWGLEPDREVGLIAIGGPPDRLLALQAGRVDAVLLQPPLTLRAQKAGFNRLAALVDLGLDYVGTSLGTTRAVINRKEDLVRRVARAFVEGIHFYKTNKEASIKAIARLMKTDDAEALEEAYNAYALKFMARVPYPALKGVEAILEDLARTNAKARGADPKRFIEPRFLRELEESGFVARLYGQ